MDDNSKRSLLTLQWSCSTSILTSNVCPLPNERYPWPSSMPHCCIIREFLTTYGTCWSYRKFICKAMSSRGLTFGPHWRLMENLRDIQRVVHICQLTSYTVVHSASISQTGHRLYHFRKAETYSRQQEAVLRLNKSFKTIPTASDAPFAGYNIRILGRVGQFCHLS